MGNTQIAPAVTATTAPEVKPKTDATAGTSASSESLNRIVMFIVIVAFILLFIQQMQGHAPVTIGRISRSGGAPDGPSPFTGKFAGWDQVPTDD